LYICGFNIIETDSKQEVFAFSRGQNKEKVVVILNLSSKDKSFKLLNNKHRSVYFDIFKEAEVELSGENTLKLHAYDYFLLEKK
jgi:glycosidase